MFLHGFTNVKINVTAESLVENGGAVTGLADGGGGADLQGEFVGQRAGAESTYEG